MEYKKCTKCEEILENCICSLVDKFFKDAGPLMEDTPGQRREQVHKKQFFCIMPKGGSQAMSN